MFERVQQTLRDYRAAHAFVVKLMASIRLALEAGETLVIEVRRATRSTRQNALMWSCLTDLSRQLKWPVDGRTTSLTAEEWKEVLTAGLTRHTRVAQGIDGGWVILGSRTSRMTIGEMTALIELCHAFGAEHEIEWSPTSLGEQPPEVPVERAEEAHA